ncbi:metallophosphoesterase [Sphingobacterium sp. BS-2]|uniref:metallophosphoesterase n=1 Tax=Sphingobacterium sp. BS-2 TaxID=3377129 RepID=UPI0038FC779F
MGDIHGSYHALIQCLERSNFNHKNETLIQLGDVADGNLGVFECVEVLLKIKNLITIKVNHDVWLSQFFLQFTNQFHGIMVVCPNLNLTWNNVNPKGK